GRRRGPVRSFSWCLQEAPRRTARSGASSTLSHLGDQWLSRHPRRRPSTGDLRIRVPMVAGESLGHLDQVAAQIADSNHGALRQVNIENSTGRSELWTGQCRIDTHDNGRRLSVRIALNVYYLRWSLISGRTTPGVIGTTVTLDLNKRRTKL